MSRASKRAARFGAKLQHFRPLPPVNYDMWRVRRLIDLRLYGESSLREDDLLRQAQHSWRRKGRVV